MEIRSLTAFIDRPADTFDQAVAFWTDITGSTLSPFRGATGEFSTLCRPDGDAYLRLQRIAVGEGGSHLDVHVEDVRRFVDHAVSLGARIGSGQARSLGMRSPAGLAWCVVTHTGEGRRPSPQSAGQGAQCLVDQICLDVPAPQFEQECVFWSKLTGWELRPSTTHPEFSRLLTPRELPLRILIQRCDDAGPARAHLDLVSTDLGAVVANHVRRGATLLQEYQIWTVLADPSGLPYCITGRAP